MSTYKLATIAGSDELREVVLAAEDMGLEPIEIRNEVFEDIIESVTVFTPSAQGGSHHAEYENGALEEELLEAWGADAAVQEATGYWNE